MILPPVHFLAFDTDAVQAVGRLAGDDQAVGQGEDAPRAPDVAEGEAGVDQDEGGREDDA